MAELSTDLTRGDHAARSKDVRGEILLEAGKIDESFQKLSQLLHEAYDNGYYIRWGYSNFKEYCNDELGIEYRRAMYLVGIAQTVKDMSIDWKDVEAIGWTKMRLLIPMLKKEGLVGDWFELANELSVKDLESIIKDKKAGFDISAIGGDRIVTITFRMTPEQSEIITEGLDTAKRVAETDDNVLALEQMAFDYVMQSSAGPSKLSLEQLIKFAEKQFGVTIQIADRQDVADMVEEEQAQVQQEGG